MATVYLIEILSERSAASHSIVVNFIVNFSNSD